MSRHFVVEWRQFGLNTVPLPDDCGPIITVLTARRATDMAERLALLATRAVTTTAPATSRLTTTGLDVLLGADRG